MRPEFLGGAMAKQLVCLCLEERLPLALVESWQQLGNPDPVREERDLGRYRVRIALYLVAISTAVSVIGLCLPQGPAQAFLVTSMFLATVLFMAWLPCSSFTERQFEVHRFRRLVACFSKAMDLEGGTLPELSLEVWQRAATQRLQSLAEDLVESEKKHPPYAAERLKVQQNFEYAYETFKSLGLIGPHCTHQSFFSNSSIS
jgi:hypothetical protein